MEQGPVLPGPWPPSHAHEEGFACADWHYLAWVGRPARLPWQTSPRRWRNKRELKQCMNAKRERATKGDPMNEEIVVEKKG